MFITLVLLAVGVIEVRHRVAEKSHPCTSPLPEKAARSWVSIRDGHLQEGPNNDGDSFLIAHGENLHEFRLYFVDCPEKRQIGLNKERLREQGDYFDGLPTDSVVEVGLQAKSLTEHLLTTQPFSVHTKWQRVYDSQRCYALITFDDGEDLSAKLVRAGLARIHTAGTTLPDGTREAAYKATLRTLETEAKAARRGAWGLH